MWHQEVNQMTPRPPIESKAKLPAVTEDMNLTC